MFSPTFPSRYRHVRTKTGAIVSAFSLIAAGLLLSVTPSAPAANAIITDAADAAPAPAAGPVIWYEDFENDASTLPAPPPVALGDYTSKDGLTYTADASWTYDASDGNGWITTSVSLPPIVPNVTLSKVDSGGSAAWDVGLGLAYAVGDVQSTGHTFLGEIIAPTDNHALVDLTNPVLGTSQTPGTLFKLAPTISLSAVHYFSASALVSNAGCLAHHDPLTVQLTTSANSAPLSQVSVDPCTAAGADRSLPALPGLTLPGDIYTALARTPAVLVSSTTQKLGATISSDATSGNGNDYGIDDIRITDVTPTATLSLSDDYVGPDSPMTATITITNTADLLAKTGWNYRLALSRQSTELQSGVTSDCPNAVVTINDGLVDTTADLAQGMASCTITIPFVATNSPAKSDEVTVPTTSGSLGVNLIPTNSMTFVLDDTAPSVPGISAASRNKIFGVPRPTLSGTGEVDAEGVGATVTLYDTTDGAHTPLCTTTVQPDKTWSCTPDTDLADGPHTYTAQQADQFGNTSSATSNQSISIDTTPPAQPTITQPEPDDMAGAQTTFKGTGSPGAVVTVTEMVDGVPVTLCTSADPYPNNGTMSDTGEWSCVAATNPLAAGPHTVTASQTKGDDTPPASEPVTFTVDDTVPGPATVLVPGPDAHINEQPPAITGTGEPGAWVTLYIIGTNTGTIDYYQVPVDEDGNWSAVPDAPWPDDTYDILALQTDAAGNTTDFATADEQATRFYVDTAQPMAPTLDQPADQEISADSAVPISGTGEIDATVTVTDGDTVVCTATVDADGNWACADPVPLKNGTHALAATQTDQAGNDSGASDTVTVTVDAPLPAAPAIASPDDQALIKGGTPTFTGTGDEGLSVVVRDGDVEICTTTVGATGTWECTPTAKLAEGPHTITAVQVDAAGNESGPSKAVAITTDSIAPDTPIVSYPADGGTVTTARPTFSGTGDPGGTVMISADSPTNPAYLEICRTTVDKDGNWQCVPDQDMADGVHGWIVFQNDAAGNGSQATDFMTLTVDTSGGIARPDPPEITTPGDRDALPTAKPPIAGIGDDGNTVTVRDENGAVVCETTVGAGGIWSCLPTDDLGEGSHTLTATQADAAGHESLVSNQVTITVDTAAPAAPIVTNPADGAVIKDTTPTIAGTGEPDATVEVTLDGEVVCATTVISTKTWTCPGPTPTLDDGDHTVSATQTDAAGNPSDAGEATFTVDTAAMDAPTIATPTGGSFADTAKPAFTGTGLPDTPLTLSEHGTTICSTTTDAEGGWTCTPATALTEGQHTVVAQQFDQDGTGSLTASVTFTVDTMAPARPEVISPADGAATDDPTPTFTGIGEPGAHVVVTDGGATICEADVDSANGWTCTPITALGVGAHALSVTQTDASGKPSDPTELRVTITPEQPPQPRKPDAPTVTAPADGATLTDPTPTFTGTGEDGATLTIKDGTATICTTTVADGRWTCTPTADLGVGAHAISVTQTDQAGTASDAVNLTITIAAAQPSQPATPSDTNTPTPTFTGTPNSSPSSAMPTFIGTPDSTPSPSAASSGSAPTGTGGGSAPTGGTAASHGGWTPAFALAGLALIGLAVRRWRLA